MRSFLERYGWLCIPLLLFCIYLPQIAPTVTTAYGGADGGELATAVWHGGVPHPPGYPTYLLAGRVTLLLPWGEPAWRLGVLSAIAAASSTAIVAAAMLQAHQTRPNQGHRWAGAMCTALALGLNSRLITQALIVEVYSLALCFLGLLLWLTARWWRWNHPSTLIAMGLTLGLGLGIQLPILAWVLGIAGVAVFHRSWQWRAVGIVALSTLVGVSVYGILIWRGQALPAFSWGDWTTAQGMWSHITAGEYRYLAGIVPWPQRIARIGYVVQDIAVGLGPVGTGLALMGIVGAPVAAGWRIMSGLSALATVIWAIGYGGADSEAYLLPLHAIGAIWAGHGILHILTIPSIQRHGRKFIIVGICLMLIPPQRLINFSLRTAVSERENAIRHLMNQSPNAIMYTNDDRQTFPLWYSQRVLGVRPDVLIIDQRLIDREWYHRHWLSKPQNTP